MCQIDGYLAVDEIAATSSIMTDEEIINAVQNATENASDNDQDDENENEEQPKVRLADVYSALRTSYIWPADAEPFHGKRHKSTKHLKHLEPIAIKHLTNITININTIPQIWKTSKIIPITKPNKNPSLPSSYKPIALLSPIAKTLEKIILLHITTNIIFPTYQHGFRAAHSTTTALHQINNTILTGFNINPPIEQSSPPST